MILDGNKLRKRKNNIWELRIYRNGKSKSIYGKTQQAVKLKYEEYKTNNKTILDNKTKSILLKEWTINWLKTYKKPFIAESTYKILCSVIQKHIINNTIGNTPIEKITNLQIQNYLNKLEQKGNTKSKLKFYIKDIFKKAVDNKIIKNDITTGIKTTKTETKHCIALTKIEQKTLINFKLENETLKKFYLYCLYSGCRRNEALNLKLSDIKNGYIHIKGTKTKQSDRYIPLFKSIEKLFENEKNEEIFKNIKPDYATRHFKDILPNHILKDLRRTFATNCYETGIKDKTIQKWLGHTTVQMTQENYIEIKQNFEFEEAEKLNKFSTQI